MLAGGVRTETRRSTELIVRAAPATRSGSDDVNPGYYWPVTYARRICCDPTRDSARACPAGGGPDRGSVPLRGTGRREASGVVAVEDGFLIVFNDSRNVGRIGRDLTATAGHRVIVPS